MFTNPFCMRSLMPLLMLRLRDHKIYLRGGQANKSADAALTRTFLMLCNFLCKGIAYASRFPSFPYMSISEAHTNEPEGHLERFHLRAAYALLTRSFTHSFCEFPCSIPQHWHFQTCYFVSCFSVLFAWLQPNPAPLFLSGNPLPETRPPLYKCFRCCDFIRAFSLTHGLTPCFINRKAYAGFGEPAFCLRWQRHNSFERN